MAKKKDKGLAQVNIEGRRYGIRATYHALERMEERKIEAETVVGNILLLGKEKIKELQELEQEIIIIDEDTNTSLVIGFKQNKIKVITVINKSNVFVKKGTKIVNL